MGIAVIGRIGAALVHVAPGDTRRADHYHAIGDAIATWVRHRHVKAKVTRGINRGGYAALGDAIVIAATPQRCMVRNHLDGIVDACRAALGYTREAREREAREREARKADTVRELRRVVTQHKRQAPLKHNPFAVLRGTFDLS